MNHSGSPGIRAIDVWEARNAFEGPLFQRLEAVGLLFFVRAATLGADTTDGAGALVHGQVGSLLPLHSRLTTGNVVDNDTYTSLVNANLFTRDRRPGGGEGGNLIFETEFQLEQILNQSVGMGLTVAPPIGPIAADGVLFRHDTGVGVNWLSETFGAAVETQDTLIVADDLFHIFRFEKTATAVRFYIDGVLVTTHTTQIPDVGDAGQLSDIVVGIRTEEVVAKSAKYGYVAVWNE